jgi:predicted nuclease of predicted toxin-antitoxin system
MEYLVDVNLPKYFSFFNKPEFHFVADIDTRKSDSEIWQTALQNNWVILTKDVDFYSRCLLSKEKVKVVYFNIGNKTLAQLHAYFEANWNVIAQLISTHYLVVANAESVDVLI